MFVHNMAIGKQYDVNIILKLVQLTLFIILSSFVSQHYLAMLIYIAKKCTQYIYTTFKFLWLSIDTKYLCYMVAAY